MFVSLYCFLHKQNNSSFNFYIANLRFAERFIELRQFFMQNLRTLLLLEFNSTAKNIDQWIEEYKEMPPEVLD